MKRNDERTIKIYPTTYQRIKSIQKSLKLRATIKEIVNLAIKNLKIREREAIISNSDITSDSIADQYSKVILTEK